MRRELLAIVAALVSALGACASNTGYKYTFDPAANFSGGAKTYTWVTSLPKYSPSSPLEEYIQFSADKVLEAKGWKRVADGPQLVFSVNFEQERFDTYQLRLLNLRATRNDTGDAIWRGTAVGSIDGNAASSELKETVKQILSTFPPS